jgi:hypothetical protein
MLGGEARFFALIRLAIAACLLGACGASDGEAKGKPSSPTPSHPGSLLVLDQRDQPIPALRVQIDGALVTTDANGRASVPNLSQRYDAVTRVDSYVYAYQGLSSRGPTLKLRLASSTAAASSFFLELKAEPGTNQELYLVVGVESEDAQPFVTGSPQSLAVNWYGSSSATLSVEAFLADVDPMTRAVLGYAGYAQHSWAAANGMSDTWEPTFSAPPFDTTTIHVDLSAPADTTLVAAGLLLEPSAGKQGFFGAVQATRPSIDFLVPATAARYEVYAQVARENDNSSATAHDVTAGARVNLTVPAAPAAIAPADSTADVTLDTEFTWSPVTDAVYYLIATSSLPPAPSYFVFTSTPSAHLPDTSALGLELPQVASYSWSACSASHVSLDSYAAGARPTGGGASAPRNFQTAGN